MFSKNTVAVTLCLALALGMPGSPTQAQSLSDELEALDAQLPGTLVNDPSRIDWDSYGPEFHAESFLDETIPGGAARRFHVNKASEFIYTAGANIPLIRTVKRGEQVTIGFYARTVEAATENGKGVLRVRFQKDSPPYPGFGEETLEIGTDWDWYEVTAKAEQALQNKTGIVAMQFGRTKQILEIGQAIVVTGARSIVGEPKPAPAAAKTVPSAPRGSELPAPLRDGGTLINDPTDRDWSVAAEGGAFEERDEAGIWLGKATRLATSSDRPGQVLVVIDIPAELAEGEELLVALAAKTVTSARADGKAVLGVSLAAAGDTAPLSSTAIALGANWQLVRFVTKAPRKLEKGTAAVGLLIEGVGEAVDVGPVYVLQTGNGGG
ncbi:hypothetical protein ACXYL9_07420 [Qipengyuania sp. CAU 1752]